MTQPNAAALLQQGGFTQPKTREQLLQEWIDADKAMRAAKDLEAAARKAVVESIGFDPEKKEGTERLPLANGWEIKAVKKQNYSLKNAAGETDLALDKMEKMGEEGKFLAERLVKWKPDLSIKEWKELPEKFKPLFATCLTISDGMPTLELIEPKVKS